MERKKIIILAVVLLVALSVIFFPGFSDLQKIKEENEELLKRIGLLEENNDRLKEELVKMEKDPEYIERKAREKLGIVKKGEIIYRKK